MYEMSRQSRFDARYWMLGAGALGRPRGMVWGGRREEGSGWGAHVYLWQIHFDIWKNQYNIVKFKNKIKLKKNNNKIKTAMNYPLFAGPTDDSGVFAQQCTLLLNLHTFKAACPLWYPLAPELTSNLLFNLPFWT